MGMRKGKLSKNFMFLMRIIEIKDKKSKREKCDKKEINNKNN